MHMETKPNTLSTGKLDWPKEGSISSNEDASLYTDGSLEKIVLGHVDLL